MALSDLLLNKTSTPGLWFVKSRNISEDISQIIYDLAVSGALFLEIYTSDKERIVNSVISRITQDLKRNASSPNERLWIEDDLSYYYEYGTFSLWWRTHFQRRFQIGGGFSCRATFADVARVSRWTGSYPTASAKPATSRRQAQKKREALCRPALKSAGAYFPLSIRSAVSSTPSSVCLKRRIS